MSKPVYLLYVCLTCRIVSSLDEIAATISLPTGDTLRDSTDSFDVEISHIELSSVPNEGHIINFGKPSTDACILPKTLFEEFDSNVVLSSSLFSQTAVFRGEDTSVSFASKVFSVSVIGKSVSNLAEPITLTFEKTVDNVSPSCSILWRPPFSARTSCVLLGNECVYSGCLGTLRDVILCKSAFISVHGNYDWN